MGIYITSDVAATGTVTVGTQTLSFSVTPNTVVRKFLGQVSGSDAPNTSVYLTQDDGIVIGGAIHVVSDNPVVVYAHIIKTSRSGASLILPSTVWGNKYIVPSYGNYGPSPGYGAITVVAAEANTSIQIIPSVNSKNGSKLAGNTYTITLANPGDVYQLQFANNSDISGTKVQSISTNGSSCKRIAVFSSTSWSAFGCTSPVPQSGDNLYQQLFPTGAWGKNFLTAPAKTRTSDIYRVFVTDPTTVVQKTENGVTTTLTGLVSNSFYEYATGSPTFIQTDKPASVVQYFTTEACQSGANIGDPEMIILNPIEQTINNITVFSAHKNFLPTNQSAVGNCYLNIIIKTNAKGSFKINNGPPSGAFVAIPGTDYSYLQEDVSAISAANPVQTLAADSSFIAIAYGFGSVESYGYNAGTNVKDFTPVATFQNPYGRIDSAVTCVNSPLKFSVPLSFVPSSLNWDFSAAPNISPNATVTPANVTADSTKTVNGQTLNYYSTGNTYVFIKGNTSALRDTIKLYTTSSTPDGCGSTSQLYAIPVTVRTTPVAAFSATTSGCLTDSVHFTDQSAASGPVTQWQWNFGDGTSANLSTGNTAKLYGSSGSGNYLIKLKVVNDIGCISDSATQTIQITAKPVAKFTFPTLLCPNSDIVFTDASTSPIGAIVKWTWNLDDGAGSFTNTTNASPKTQYAVYGTKNPVLVVETGTGCKSDTFAPNPQLKINPLPVVGFILPEVCLNDANAPFTDTTTIAEGSLASYLWNFNAGSPAVSPGPNITSSTVKNPQVKYNKSDNYKVSLTVTSALGCVATGTEAFTVNGTTPKADFSFANAAPYCGTKPVLLKNNSSVDFGNLTKLEIYWDFANNPTVVELDDNPTAGKVYPHSYADLQSATGKSYTIKLVAYSGGSTCSDFTTKTITVYSQPKAAFNVSASQLCFGDNITFTDKSTSISSAESAWSWKFGDGNVSAAQNPVNQYNDSGLFTASLYFYNKDGCISDTASQQLTVYPNPKVVLQHSVKVLAGGTLQIIPEYVYGTNLQYLWSPATYLNSDTAINPVCKPDDDITYKLTLTANGGCSASDTVFVNVLKGPVVPNVFSPNGDGINDTWNIKYLDSYPGATIDVYNRYGQAVYHSVGYAVSWDGTYHGSPLPVGTYYYIINPKNGRQVVSGSVTIIK